MAHFSNSSAGDHFDSQCTECPLGQLPCPIAWVQMEYNYAQLRDGNGDLKKAMTDLVSDEEGCKTFLLLKQKGLAPVQEVEPSPIPAATTILPSMLAWAKQRGIA